jgi:hypothetical protein
MPPVTNPVTACAGAVEIVDGGRHDYVLPDRRVVCRVRSLRTGAECWAYLAELVVESVA